MNNLSCTYPQLKDQSAREVTKNCHVLCCFWKTGTDNGVLEFYHNNIRDFFLCEKIYREVNRLYLAKTWDDTLTVLRFVELFQHYHLEEQVCQFIRQRSECCKDDSMNFCWKDFPLIEYRQRHLPNFFQLMVTNGRLFLRTETPDKVFKGVFSDNPIKSILNVLECVINLYDLAYLPHLRREELISFWHDTDVVLSVNSTDLLQHLFLAPNRTFYLSLANLSKADLFRADLFRADLNRANLRGADLRRTDLFMADLRKADLRAAKLSVADLREADLCDADLRGADLYYADLCGTILPDGFSSNIQAEQVEHLKSLNIEGLKI